MWLGISRDCLRASGHVGCCSRLISPAEFRLWQRAVTFEPHLLKCQGGMRVATDGVPANARVSRPRDRDRMRRRGLIGCHSSWSVGGSCVERRGGGAVCLPHIRRRL